MFGVLLPLYLFGWLAETVWNRNGLDWDSSALNFVHQYAAPTRDKVMIQVTHAGSVQFVIIMGMHVALGLVARQQRQAARFLARCLIGTVVINFAVKAAFHRVRPHLWESPAPETDFGFPSGHAMDSLAFAFAFAVIAWPTRRRWPVLFIGCIYVAAVGVSRLYLGVHYPSDVLGAWALALAWLCGLLLFQAASRAEISRNRKTVVLAVGIAASLTTALAGYVSSDFDHDNLRVLVPGQAYRAGKMSPNVLARCIKKNGIKSVLNLRGENSNASWHQAEIALTGKVNVSHYDRSLSAGTELSMEQMDEIVSLLRQAPKPILIHCDGGADRSALVSALYLLTVEGRTSDAANKELSIWNGHLPSVWPRVTAMDRSFWHYVSNRGSMRN
jgi:membrane-associated phospholipid phosphatase/protein tyrosine phosphatase (PTP) superfamily phosphohydrolase (DUF442 family)